MDIRFPLSSIIAVAVMRAYEVRNYDAGDFLALSYAWAVCP